MNCTTRYTAPCSALQCIIHESVFFYKQKIVSLPLFRRSISTSGTLVAKPISFVVAIIEQSPKSINDQSIIQIIADWKRVLGEFFLNLKKSKPEQPCIIRLLAINPENGKVLEIDKIDISITEPLEKVINQCLGKAITGDQNGDYRLIEDLIARQEDVSGKKQIWVNPEDLNVTIGPISDVFYYLNKIAGYDYLSQEDVQNRGYDYLFPDDVLSERV